MRTVSINKLLPLVLVASVASLSGCAMCTNPFDCDYAAYGSRLPRADMAHGRVGSILDGSSAGVVTTQPIYEDGGYVDGEAYSDGEVIFSDAPSFQSSDSGIYDSPILMEPLETMPAQNQIDRVYESIQGENGAN